MKLNFCTLFDSNYISRGLALHQSLAQVCRDFHLYIFAFDEKADKILRTLQLDNVTVVSLKEFEDEELLRVKPGRTRAEYCWTCSSSSILFAINRFQLQNCTYIDADLYFYSDPSVLVREMGSASVLITEHNYAKQYDQSAISGKYCVQFMFFKADENGMRVLNWWRNECIKWCFNRVEDGKFGDQKYLDDWTTRFNGVHVMQHSGGGIAPWNMRDYKLKQTKENYLVKYKGGVWADLVFVHYHDLVFYYGGKIRISKYKIPAHMLPLLFFPYIKQLLKQERRALSIDESINASARKQPERNTGFSFRYKLAAYRKAMSTFSLSEMMHTMEQLKSDTYIDIKALS